MSYTVHFRRADGEGTKTYMSGLGHTQSLSAQRAFFKNNPDVTMCWVLDDRGDMHFEALTRDPPEDETTRIMRAT